MLSVGPSNEGLEALTLLQHVRRTQTTQVVLVYIVCVAVCAAVHVQGHQNNSISSCCSLNLAGQRMQTS